MFFDGEEKGRRAISLRGKGKRTAVQQDRGEFLEKTRKEREERETLRRHTKGATGIQAFFRGRRDVRRQRILERSEWDQLVCGADPMSCSVSTEIEIPVSMPTDQFCSLMRQLLFFHRHSVDWARLSAMCRSLLSRIKSQDQLTSLSSLISKAETCSLLLHQVQRLLRITSEVMEIFATDGLTTFATDGDKPQEEQLKFLMRVMLIVTDDTSWRGASTQQHERVFCAQVMAYLVKNGLYGSVRRMLFGLGIVQVRGERPAHCEQLLSSTMALAVRPFAYGAVVADGAQFGVHIMSIPFLLVSLPSVGLQLLDRAEIWATVLGGLADGSRNGLPSWPAAYAGESVTLMSSWLLGNLLRMSHTKIHVAAIDMIDAYLVVLNVLWPMVPRYTSTSMILDDDDDALACTTVCGGMSGVPAQLEDDLQLMASPLQMQLMLKIFSHSPANDASITALCALILWLIEEQPMLRDTVLRTVAFTPRAVNMMHDSFVALLEHDEYAQSVVGAKTSAAPINRNMVQLGTIFSLSYDFLLMTDDDIEFYEKQRPFALSVLCKTVVALKQLAFRLYWCPPPMDPQLIRFRAAVTRLLRKLYDRNSQRTFLATEDWCCAEVSSEKILSDTSILEMFDSASEEDSRAASLLRHVPFMLRFDERALIFQHLIMQDKEAESIMDWTRVTIRREFVVEDGFAGLNHLGSKLKKTVQIQFINHDGLEEAGIDGGGVFKEFLNTLVKAAFDPQYGLFNATAERQLYPNPNAHVASTNHIRMFEFLGRVCGKAMRENILVELPLCSFFLSKILGKPNYVNDVPSLDAELYKNLMVLKYYSGDVEEDLCLNFSVADDHFGQTVVHDLIPGGKDIAVTDENRIRYIYLIADWKLNKQISAPSAAFMRGLQDLIRPEWLRMFNQDELQRMISGATGELDLLDLQRNTVYSGGYFAEHPTILCFWAAVAALDSEQKRALLLFVTSCSRAPLLGFQHLHPKFCIHKSGDDETRLASASTCMNLLKLPPYKDADHARDKLVYAISSGAGFELS